MSDIAIGPYYFRSKSQAKNFVRELRDRYADGELVAGEDHDFLAHLLDRHPEREGKIGSGILGFTVATEKVFGKTRHFIVKRMDGSHTDFSFLSCIDGRNPRADILQALRMAVTNQITDFANDQFRKGVVCAIDGIRLCMGNSHVDHVHPVTFMNLVNHWISVRGICLEDIEVLPSTDNNIVARMADKSLEQNWSDYHREKAVLRLISARANLALPKK
jgi:hypothetical protein